ncbi:hypothetical protein DdX_12950 [Ditylenchus destructor]|uniref:F-box domain-containing protein n=1 Tax=Ditylenchus destructor TaxID=166010 RepID=A0AAD4MXA7_9BILA|nr:hypothetical protein DdX_12950 [Ditylenchus destructor]
MENRNRKILLPTDITADILRHLSRKKLSRDVYLVNRNIWQIAASSHFVPNVHSIKELYINTNTNESKLDFISDVGNLVRISKRYIFPTSIFVKEMPTPGPFVRFGKVWIQHCDDDALIEFLRDAKEPFVGCALKIDFHDSISNDEVVKFAYLIENAFMSAAKIALNEVKRFSPSNFDYTQELHCALLNWLHDDGSERSTLAQHESKHLVLGQYPREMILDMVEHVKQRFEDVTLPPAAFLITFIGSEAGFYEPCLEGEHTFSLSKPTGEKLSFFKTRAQRVYRNGVYRLWRRKVLKKAGDWMMKWTYTFEYVKEIE